jgi:nitroreductase
MSLQTDELNKILDQIIESRRSIRKFKQEVPPRELIEKILHAGLLAPFAAAGASREDFRRFIVIPRESKAMEQAIQIVNNRLVTWIKQIETQMQTDQFVKTHAGPFYERLKMMPQYGMPNLGKAPYYIVVAEAHGFPQEEQLSIAHCLQNMWLKATALGLGMQLLSITQSLDKDQGFCELIKIPLGEYALDGCLIGYADINPPAPRRPNLNQITRWLN